ncbi:Two-component response regulator ARR17 [Platanthera zijinensis]|uniref:Two-component response regulator ARR17 n=1 Tax=Platanthera zijinensis TaxID=2320716 RepID=A0AAP0B3D8_9ASPA
MSTSSSSSAPAFDPMAEVDAGELHVLAVDDCVVERLFLERMLKDSEYKVTTAENGVRALEYLGLLGGAEEGNQKKTDVKIHLIITDYCMPGMTGYELMKKIKEISYLKEIPVVIMSSENIPTRIEKCLEEGAEEFMLKPIQKSDVKRLRCHVKSLNDPSLGRLCLGR